MAGDGMEDAHRVHVDDERRRLVDTRKQVEAVAHELRVARDDLHELEDNLKPAREEVARLEKALECLIKKR